MQSCFYVLSQETQCVQPSSQGYYGDCNLQAAGNSIPLTCDVTVATVPSGRSAADPAAANSNQGKPSVLHGFLTFALFTISQLNFPGLGPHVHPEVASRCQSSVLSQQIKASQFLCHS